MRREEQTKRLHIRLAPGRDLLEFNSIAERLDEASADPSPRLDFALERGDLRVAERRAKFGEAVVSAREDELAWAALAVISERAETLSELIIVGEAGAALEIG